MTASSARSQESSITGFSADLLTDEELYKVVTNLRTEVRILKLENEVLEKTIKRLDPALMNNVYQAVEYAMRKHLESSLTFLGYSSSAKVPASKFSLIESLLGPSRMFTSSSRMSIRRVDSSGRLCGSVMFGTGPKINLNERLELLDIIIDHQIKELQRCRDRATKRETLFRAQQEEFDIRLNDIDDAIQLFDQEVLIDGWDKIAQRIPAEVWIKFMSEWEKRIDQRIGKLRLRGSTLNIQYRKLNKEIKRKAELSEKLTPVDFDKIKMENTKCVKLLDSKMIQIDEVKAMAGDANLNLAQHKRTLLFLNTYLATVRKTKIRRDKEIEQFEKKIAMTQAQVNTLTQEIDTIKKLRMKYNVPNVMDYVDVKARASELMYAIKRLETKLLIKQNAIASAKKQLQVLLSQMRRGSRS